MDLVESGFRLMPIVVAALLAGLAWLLVLQTKEARRWPVLNARYLFEFGTARAIARFEDAKTDIPLMISTRFPDTPVRVHTGLGSILVLPFKHAEEIRNHPLLDMLSAVGDDFHSGIPGLGGFDTFTIMKLIGVVARKPLRLAMGNVVPLLAEEAAYGMTQAIGNPGAWRNLKLHHICEDMVGRLSAKIFVGDELCRNEEWLGLVRLFTKDAFAAARILSGLPACVRPIAHWFLPECQRMRAHGQKARVLVESAIHQYRKDEHYAAGRSGSVTARDNALQWAQKEAKTAFDPYQFQLVLSFVAVETSTDLLTTTMCRIVQDAELTEQLRQEISRSLIQHGWTESALANMILLDSVMKEAQRLKPPELTTLRRLALADVTLSDGTFIPKNTKIALLNLSRMDDKVYTDPKVFDPMRFLRYRDDPVKARKAHFVSTSVESLPFGNGKQACPGRFFAANEVKLAISHLLLGYDWESTHKVGPSIVQGGFNISIDDEFEVKVRSRASGIDKNALG